MEDLSTKLGVINGPLVLVGMTSNKMEHVLTIAKSESNVQSTAANGRLQPLLVLLPVGPPEYKLAMATYLGNLALRNDVNILVARIMVGTRVTSTMALQISIPKPLEDYNTLTKLWLLLQDGRQGTSAANYAIFYEPIVVIGPSIPGGNKLQVATELQQRAYTPLQQIHACTTNSQFCVRTVSSEVLEHCPMSEVPPIATIKYSKLPYFHDHAAIVNFFGTMVTPSLRVEAGFAPRLGKFTKYNMVVYVINHKEPQVIDVLGAQQASMTVSLV